jgi:hypothetical protein
MQLLKPITFDGALSLAELEAAIAGNETHVGPLVDLKIEGSDTIATFDQLGANPTQPANLFLVVNDVTPQVNGSILVCQGNCMIQGQPMGVAALRVSPGAAAPGAGAAAQVQLAWGAKVSSAFRTKVRAIASSLGTNPNFLMASMAFETGRSFSPSERNPASSATGLIQFMSSTAQQLGTSTAALAAMTAEDQLDYVEKYFAPYKNKLDKLPDVYMAILWPAAVSLPDESVIFSTTDHPAAYQANKGLDANRDGQVTKAEAASRVVAMLAEGLLPGNVG